jgi:2-methylisocitrate lyase-like PEP mutase family enzyme
MSLAQRFSELHEDGCFVMPNPWDAGSAKLLEDAGFEALATTSSGFAQTLGRSDGEATVDEVVGHVGAITAAVSIPLSVDLENGYDDPAAAISRVAEAGAVGGSIEDFSAEEGIYEVERAVERVSASVSAARSLDFPFTLTARAENHIRGNPDLDDTIARLKAYEAAGADVLYAPGLASSEEIRAVCEAVSLPVNVLAWPGLTLEAIAEAGARRVSVGGALAFLAVGTVKDAARRLADGDLGALSRG